jgi:hypothetical protein
MSKISETLKDRGSRYGSMEGNAKVAQGLLRVIEQAPTFDQWSDCHKETVHMIFHKIARMCNGDPNYVDNVHDIVGYGKLLEDHLIKLEKEKTVAKGKRHSSNSPR